MRNTRMFINIFFVVLLSLAHGKPVPSDPILVCKPMDKCCREDPSLEGCEEIFGPADEPSFGPTDDPMHLIKVEGGDEYLVEMEPRVEVRYSYKWELVVVRRIYYIYLLFFTFQEWSTWSEISR